MPTNSRRARWTAAVIACALLLGTGGLYAQNDDVANTLHNLSANSGTLGIVDYDEVCVYCHTPHGGQIDAPLWNRSYPAGPYQMYSSATIDMAQINPGSPTGVSLACLSCHDGTIALDVVTNPPNSYTGPAPSGTDFMPAGPRLLGEDLRDDHPVSVFYDNSAATGDPMFNDPATVLAAGVKLFGAAVNEVQCASCHNPHNNTNAPLLRISNSGSALCTTCHIK